MKTNDFKTSAYFSGTIIFAGVLLALAGLFVMVSYFMVGAVIILVSVIIFTTHYRLRIDFENKTFHDYVWLLGTKHGEKGAFDKLEYLFIKKSKVTQTMNIRVASSTIRKDVFDGYLKFSETNKIHLMTMDDKDDLIRKLKILSRQLNSRVIDYSNGEPQEI